MDDKQKIINKLFSAPSKKKNSIENSNEKAKEKSQAELKKPALTMPVKKKTKKSNLPIHPTISGSVVKDKPKKDGKRVCKSLTDEEYAEIFNSVLNQGPDEVSVPSASVENTRHESAPNSPSASNVAQSCEDELDELVTDLPIDQWNDKSEDSKESHKQVNFTAKKKIKEKEKTTKPQKEKMNISTKHPKQDKKPKMKSLYKKAVNENNAIARKDLIKPEKDDEEEEEEEETDKHRNTCDATEVDYDESEHILTTFTLGSIVWAKMDGFPWWPAMIDTDPDYDTYFELPTATSMMPYMYHVTFIDEHVSRSWVRSHLITPYDPRSAPVNKVTAKSQSYKRDLRTAISNAELALKLNLQDRIDKYSFVKRYSKPKRTIAVTKKKTTKGKRSKEILSSPEAMLKEIEMAIETCNNSNDSDFSEDDVEYLPKKICQQDPTTDLKTAPAHTDKEKEKEHSQQLSESECDSESESQTVAKRKTKQCDENKFDPDIFTMELDPLEDPHQEVLSKSNGSNDDCNDDCNGDGSSETKETNEDNQPTLSIETSGNFYDHDESKNILKPKEGNIEDNDAQGLSVSKFRKGKQESLKKTKKKEKVLKEITPSKNDNSEQLTDFDTEKENKDPDVSDKLMKPILLSCKRKTELHSEKVNSNKKKKKSTMSGKKQEMSPKSETNETKVSKKNIKEFKDLSNGRKKTEKREFACSTVSHDVVNGNEMSNDNKDVSNCEKETPERDITQKASAVTKKKKPKGFLNPIKDKTVCKFSDRKVPGSPFDEIKNTNKKPKLDQFVPDVTNEFIEDELAFSSNETDTDYKSVSKKNDAEKKDSCVEAEDDELNLSIDSLEDECLDIGAKTNEDESGKGNTAEVDKHPYGKFGGHCSEHGSDSDPFELIED